MEHQKGAGQRGAAQPDPAPPTRNSEIAPTGDRPGMGHRDTSAQLGGHSGIFDARGGFAETPAAPAGNARSSQAVKANTAACDHEMRHPVGIGAWALLAMLRVYQIFLSPFLGGACKFYPSCSNYAVEAIQRHGAGHGFMLAMKRLGRCRPFTRGGFDPVPTEDARHADVRGEEPVN
jgi:uncharacterized protein